MRRAGATVSSTPPDFNLRHYPPQTPRHHRITAFCAWRRFSDSSKITECGPSITALVADHHALQALTDRFAKGANAVLGEPNGPRQREAVCRFLTDLTDFDRRLVRHLTDEEDLILPVVLKHRVG
jgi:hypothetical protein